MSSSGSHKAYKRPNLSNADKECPAHWKASVVVLKLIHGLEGELDLFSGPTNNYFSSFLLDFQLI